MVNNLSTNEFMSSIWREGTSLRPCLCRLASEIGVLCVNVWTEIRPYKEKHHWLGFDSSVLSKFDVLKRVSVTAPFHTRNLSDIAGDDPFHVELSSSSSSSSSGLLAVMGLLFLNSTHALLQTRTKRKRP
jgi:hypothetical protein